MALRSRRAGAVPWSALLLGLTAVASGLTAALVWRANHEPVPPALEGADALVAEAARLLEQGDAATATLRYGEALELDPARVDARVGRARARASAGADPVLVRDDLDRALALAPRSSAALRGLAEWHLGRGDVRAAREALDRALEAAGGAPGQAAAEIDAIASVRLRVDEAARAEEAAVDRAEALLAALDGPAARSALETALAAAPASGPVLAALSRVHADTGRYDEAVRCAVEAERLDPAQALDAARLDALRLLARDTAPGALPALERWCPAWGGVWREDQGVITGQGEGLGEFSLATLLAAGPGPGADATVSVEVSLVSGDPGPYAGLILGARGKRDLYVVYVFHDPAVARSMIEPTELDEHRRRTGAWPKFVRIARIEDGRWQHRSTQRVEFPDTGFVSLKVELRGTDLVPIVAGKRGDTVRVDRPVDGRVGLAKYYDTVARFRAFAVEGR